MKMNKIILGIFSAGLLMTGCGPQIEKKEELPAPVPASFTISNLVDASDASNKNSYLFTNTTPGGYVSNWDFGGVAKSRQDVDTVFFAYAGSYEIKLQTASKGGITTTTQTLVVPANSPYAADFTITKLADDYHYKVDVTTPNPKKVGWVLPTGDTTSTASASFYWPWKGDAKITLTTTASNNGVSSITKTQSIPSDDPANPYLNNSVFNKLTGGINAVNGRTWLLNPAPFQTNVGPDSDTSTSYYHFPDGLGGDAWTQGALNNEYTFVLRNYQYIPKNTNVTASGLYAKKYFGTATALYQDIQYADPHHKPATFIPNKDASNVGTGYGFTVTNGSYIGYFEDRYKYYIVHISDDTLFLAHRYDDQPTAPEPGSNARYFTFYRKK